MKKYLLVLAMVTLSGAVLFLRQNPANRRSQERLLRWLRRARRHYLDHPLCERHECQYQERH